EAHPARVPRGRAVQARPALPHRRPRRPDRPVLPTADRRPAAVRRDRGRAAAGPGRGLREDELVELTVASLISELGLELVSGHEAADVHVRWVQSTELRAPTPWVR